MASSKPFLKQTKKLDEAIAFIHQKNFERVVEIIGVGQDTPVYGRYLVGYSLIKLNRKLEALSTWWSVLKRGQAMFQQDCKLLVHDVLADPLWQTPQWRSMSPQILTDVLAAALFYSVDHASVRELESYLVPRLWAEEQWELLGRILNGAAPASRARLLLKAKIAFAAPRKSGLKAFPFASLLMSAGASELAFSHSVPDVSIEAGPRLKALAQEIYNVYPASVEERLPLRLFLDFERRALEKVLALHRAASSQPDRINDSINEQSQPGGLNKSGSGLPYILSPGYYYTHDEAESVQAQMSDWLSGFEDAAEIQALYRREVLAPYLQMMRDCGGGKLSNLTSSFQRFADFSKKRPQQEISQKEISQQKISREFLVSLYKCAISNSSEISTKDRFDRLIPDAAVWDLAQAARALKDQNLSEVAVYWSLKNAALKFSKAMPWVESLTEVAEILKDSDASKPIKGVMDQRTDCAFFLKSLTVRRGPLVFKISDIVKNEQTFRDHFTRLANTRLLLPPDQYPGSKKGGVAGGLNGIAWEKSMAAPYMRHVYQLIIKSAHLNLDLSDERESVLECQCESCQRHIYDLIPDLAQRIGCPPLALHIEQPQSLRDLHIEWSETKTSSIFEQENPFQILQVTPKATKAEVLTSLMTLMRAKPAEMGRLRRAQDQAFHPDVRFLYGLLKSSDHPSLIVESSSTGRERGDDDFLMKSMTHLEVRSKDMIL